MQLQPNKTWNFDPWAERYDDAVAKDTDQYYANYKQVLSAVVDYANLAPGKRVLDIATGTGELAVRCLATGAYVVGVDPSEPMLAKAREKVGENPNVKFHQCPDPFLSLPYPDAHFDAVVSTYAYHHIPHHQRAASVREMLRALKPDGQWIIGDLAFKTESAEKQALRKFHWLEAEYFTYLDHLGEIFAEFGIKLQTQQFTPVTWVFWATR